MSGEPRIAKKTKRATAEVRAQVGALPVRFSSSGEPEILLVTTRTTRRWIVPKGWRSKRLKDHDAAAREAREEAGIVGRVRKKPIGQYEYWKRMQDHFVLCEVTLYRLDARRQLADWQEQSQRRSHWFKLEDAADIVDEPGLKALLRSLKLD